MSSVGNEGQDHGLSGLINQTTYQQPTGSDGVTVGTEGAGVHAGGDSGPSGAAHEGSSPAVGNTHGTPVGTGTGQGVTTQPTEPPAGNDSQPTPPDPRLQQYEETIQNQARYIQMHQQQLAQDQERQFRASLEDMSEEEQRAAIAERQAQQLRAHNMQLQQRQRQDDHVRQDSAKRTLALMVAVNAGLDPSLSSTLMGAQSPEEMESIASTLAQRLQASQPQGGGGTAPPQHDPAMYAAGGDHAPSSTPKDIETGSGDLMGLIGQTQYQVASAIE